MKLDLAEDRLSAWAKLRQELNYSETPLDDIADYWSSAKLTYFNPNVDPYNYPSWPNPWQIIADNQYDDLTLALVIGYTVKLTEQFKNSRVEIRSMVDSTRTRLYNLVYIDDQYVLNYNQGVVGTREIPDSFFLENLVELAKPR